MYIKTPSWDLGRFVALHFFNRYKKIEQMGGREGGGGGDVIHSRKSCICKLNVAVLCDGEAEKSSLLKYFPPPLEMFSPIEAMEEPYKPTWTH